MDLISKNLLDLKSLEEENIGNLFKKDAVGDELIESFLQAKGDDTLWYARLLKNLNLKNLDRLILSVLDKQDVQTRIQLLKMLSDQPEPDTVKRLKELLDPDFPELTLAVLKTIKRTDPENKEVLDLETFLDDPHPEVRGQAAGCLYLISPENYRPLLDSWLDSEDPRQQRAGVLAAGETEDEYFAPRMKAMLKDEGHDHLIADILQALSKLGRNDLNDQALAFLNHPDPRIRSSALQVLNITDDNILQQRFAPGAPLSEERSSARGYLPGHGHSQSGQQDAHRLHGPLSQRFPPAGQQHRTLERHHGQKTLCDVSASDRGFLPVPDPGLREKALDLCG